MAYRQPDPLLKEIIEVAFRRFLAGEFIEIRTPDDLIYRYVKYRAIQVSPRELHVHVARIPGDRYPGPRDFLISIKEMQ